MSELLEYAKKELDRIKSDEYFSMINTDVLALVEVFEKQDHSGLSASITRNRFARLANFLPLTPLTGEESEWGTPAGKNQNNRCYSVFRNEDGSAYYIDGKVFSDDGGETWFTTSESAVPITFPFSVPSEPERVILSSENKVIHLEELAEYWKRAEDIAPEGDYEYIAALTCRLLKDDKKEAHISKEYISGYNKQEKTWVFSLELYGDSEVIKFEK